VHFLLLIQSISFCSCRKIKNTNPPSVVGLPMAIVCLSKNGDGSLPAQVAS
jgi:hypothetical protein